MVALRKLVTRRPLAPVAEPMGTAELARRCGVSPDTFLRSRERRHAEDGLPRPLSERRPYFWDRLTAEAWLGRHHPNAAPARVAANDTAPLAAPRNDAEWRDHLTRVYG